ncbi:MAG: hypothetical protein ACPG5L_18220, partial [Vibrio gallaecicus]
MLRAILFLAALSLLSSGVYAKVLVINNEAKIQRSSNACIAINKEMSQLSRARANIQSILVRNLEQLKRLRAENKVLSLKLKGYMNEMKKLRPLNKKSQRRFLQVLNLSRSVTRQISRNQYIISTQLVRSTARYEAVDLKMKKLIAINREKSKKICPKMAAARPALAPRPRSYLTFGDFWC